MRDPGRTRKRWKWHEKRSKVPSPDNKRKRNKCDEEVPNLREKTSSCIRINMELVTFLASRHAHMFTVQNFNSMSVFNFKYLLYKASEHHPLLHTCINSIKSIQK
jgi:hypothetical protein